MWHSETPSSREEGTGDDNGIEQGREERDWDFKPS